MSKSVTILAQAFVAGHRGQVGSERRSDLSGTVAVAFLHGFRIGSAEGVWFPCVSLLFYVKGSQDDAEAEEDADEDVLAQETPDRCPQGDSVCHDQELPGKNPKNDELEVRVRVGFLLCPHYAKDP